MKTPIRLAGVCISLFVCAALLAGCVGRPDDIALVGSDTIVGVMGTLGNQYQGQPDGMNGEGDSVDNVPPVLASGQTFTIPSQRNCPGVTYNSTSNPPPNGSSAGISALLNDTNGCLDIARSSRGRSTSDPSNIDFFAFAIDGVSWAGFTPGGHQPINLTQSQLQGIYLCTNGGKPLYTDWSQVGGTPGAIIRYLPQTGSGTLSFFETKLLGLSSAQQGVTDDTGCTNAPRPIRIEENSGNQVVSGFRPYAILPYSFADWHAQANGLWPNGDIRGGSYLGAINGVGPAQSSIAEGCGPCFLGRRYVYNVLKQRAPEYFNSINFAGLDPSHNGWMCANENEVKYIITAWGFVPLPLAPAGSGLPESTCRKNPTPL